MCAQADTQVCLQAVPTRTEAAAVRQGLAAVRAAAQRVWPQSTVTLFGSQVSH